MDPHSTPLRTRADLERALAEARELLPGLEDAGPAQVARFQALLQAIADYRGADPLTQPSPDVQRRHALDGQLKAYGRRWGSREETPASPWSAMLGGSPRRPQG